MIFVTYIANGRVGRCGIEGCDSISSLDDVERVEKSISENNGMPRICLQSWRRFDESDTKPNTVKVTDEQIADIIDDELGFANGWRIGDGEHKTACLKAARAIRAALQQGGEE